MRATIFAAIVLVAGCGRFGFDATGDGGVIGDDGHDAPVIDALHVLATESYLKPSVFDSNDQLGTSIALSADGQTLAAGAIWEASSSTGVGGDVTNNDAPAAGAVYIYVRTAGVWTLQAFLKASNTGPDDVFGQAVALSSDGSTLAVGAPGEASAATTIEGDQSSNAAPSSGAVYVFTRTGTVWSQQAYVKAQNAETNDFFGSAVALSADGNELAAGAFLEDSAAQGVGGDPADNTVSASGAVYTFRRAGTLWAAQAYVKSSNPDINDHFGISLALSGDGMRLVVGATGEGSGSTGIDGPQADNTVTQSGAVYVFARGAQWAQEAYVKASNTDFGDFFGYQVALSFDGATLAVSAAGEDGPGRGVDPSQAEGMLESGAVYVFRRGAAWTQEVYLKSFNSDANDQAGGGLAVTPDGNEVVVGAQGEDSAARGINGLETSESAAGSGAVYSFVRTAGTWRVGDYVKPFDTRPGMSFGAPVAVSAAGALAVGVISDGGPGNGAPNSGSVYVIE